jgi:nitroreductase
MGLMAHSEGLGSCWMGAIDRSKISAICAVPDEYEIDTLLALGYPAESPQTVDAVDGDTKYFLDDGGKLNVPKLDVDDLIL